MQRGDIMLNIGIRGRLGIAAALGLAGLIILALLSMQAMRTQMMTDRVTKVRNLTEVSLHLIQTQYDRAKKGEITEAEAKKNALDNLRDLRYASGDYFFVDDWNCVSILLPAKPEMEGKNFTDVKDANGDYFVRAQRDTAKAGGGAVYYNFNKPNSTETANKVAYVLPFAPWQWFVATGIYLEDVDREIDAMLWRVTGVLAAIVLVVGGAIFLLSRSITRPLSHLTVNMSRLAERDYSVQVRETERRDEIGDMARAVLVFKENGLAFSELQKEHQGQAELARQQRREALDKMADEFELAVSREMESVRSAAEKMLDDVSRVSDNAKSTCERSTQVATAAETSASSAQMVSAAAAELSSSIDEISRQVTVSSEIARGAVTTAEDANQVVEMLESDASAIDNVLTMIQRIAAQTNLLALNATIEAARAGEAGKGFAIVAGEVKNLANQTAEATREIGAKVSAIQSRTSGAAQAIRSVAEVISKIEEISSSIAGSVGQQDAATREIAHIIEQTASSAHEVSSNIADVQANATETGAEARDLLDDATLVATHTRELASRIATFLQKVRSA